MSTDDELRRRLQQAADLAGAGTDPASLTQQVMTKAAVGVRAPMRLLGAIGVAGFWAGATIGRLTMSHPAVARLINRVGLAGVASACAAMLLGLVVAPRGVGLGCLMLAGVALAPIVPSMFATTSGRVGASLVTRVSGWQLIATNLGAITVPAFVGELVDSQGPDIIPTVAIGIVVAVGIPLLLLTKRLPNRADA